MSPPNPVDEELMKRTTFQAIPCELCDQLFLRITNTHLWKTHRMTMDEYKERFPDTLLDAKGLAHSRVTHLRDKSYEEIYGEDKANELKQTRSEDAKTQMEDPKQIKIRKEECGYIPTDEQKQHLSKARTVHGGTTYRKRALEYYGLECERCGHSSEKPSDFVVHHKDLLNILTELGNHSIENLMVLCHPCHAKLHNEISEVQGRFAGLNDIEKGAHYILKGLRNHMGLNLNDDNLTDTPKRIARAYMEIFSGVLNTKQQIEEIFQTSFPSEYDQIVLSKGVHAWSMCPHHFLPVEYSISVAYIPSVDGTVIGISKLTRLVEILARRPVLQETLSKDTTKYLMTYLKGCQGAACVVEGKHLCMRMRGIRKQSSIMVTSSLEGVFLEDGTARAELMSMIK